MSTDFDHQESNLRLEPVERRGETRGLFRDLWVTVGDAGKRLAPEASRKGFFAELDEPDSLALGAVLQVEVERGDKSFSCKVVVVRKEIDPRHGVALRIAHISPAAEQTLKLMLES